MKTKILLMIFIWISIAGQSQIINTIAGNGPFGYSGDGGPAISAHLNNPNGIAFDRAGDLYFADYTNNVIRKVKKTTGVITTVVGTQYSGGSWYYGGDGGPADSAWLAGPVGIATDTAGNLYIADNLNNVIRKVTASTGIITTVAGDASLISMPYAFSGDGGQAISAELNAPWGVALDAAGNIYIADQGYNVVRKVTVSTGIITTVAGNGNGAYSGDNGLATSAELNGPDGVTIDTGGNIYISDDYNNVIRKVTASTGIITTIAGNGNAGYSGDGSAATSAKLNDPSLGVAIDAEGNIYITDDVNNVIRKVTAATGKISTIAGNGTMGYSGDGGPADSAVLNGPEAVAIDAAGDIYIADGNNVIRKITAATGNVPATPAAILGSAAVCYHSTNTYSVAPVNGATGYTWILPNGWSGTSTTDSIIAMADTSGTISVTANNASGSSLEQTLSVTVTHVNTSVTASGLTLTAGASAAAYVWFNCNGNIAVPGAAQQSFTATATGSYAVIITQNGCTDTSACFPADTTTGVPSIPGAIQGNTSVCDHSTNTYSVAPVNGATSYTWALPNGWTGTSTTDSIIAIVDTSGTISVTANNASGSSAAQTLHVTVNTINNAVSQAGLALTAAESGAAYAWVNCDSGILISGATHQTFTATAIGNYAVIIAKNGCTDTSACVSVDSLCNISITGADMPYAGLSVMLAVDTSTSVIIGNPGPAQIWDYSMLQMTYPKFAVYTPTSATAYAAVYPASNINTYGPSVLFGSLYGGAPVNSPGMGYVFWKSDSTGLWVTGFRTESGPYANINVQDNPHELLIGAPASYGSVFNNFARWVLPLNYNPADVDTFYVCNTHKVITADACGDLTTPAGVYTNVLREHERVINVDSVYIIMSGYSVTAFEFSRDTLNNYFYIAHGLGYPACIVHADAQNAVMNVEYFKGLLTGTTDQPEVDAKLKLYPNPSDGKITIEVPNSSTTGNLVSIYNSLGSLVLQRSTFDSVISIDAGNLSQGLYVVKV